MTRNSEALAATLCCLTLLACQCEQAQGPTGAPDAAIEARHDAGQPPVATLPLPEGAVPIQARASAADKASMDALKAKVARGAFLWAERSRRANAGHFLYMAATETDPALIAASLQAMAQSWTHDPKKTTRRPIDDDYRAVVRARLSHGDKLVLGRAMEASKHILSEQAPDPGVVAVLARIVAEHEDPAARYSALTALIQLRDIQKNKDALGALLKAFDDAAPHIVSTALRVIQFTAYGLEDKAPFIARTLALFNHADPGVRGRALLVSTALTQGQGLRTRLALQILPHLDDTHPYARSTATAALAALGHKAAIHKLITMLGDKAPNNYTLKGFQTLAGDSATISHSGSAWSRVDDAVLHAIETLSADMGEARFSVGPIKPGSVQQDLARAKRDARRWYATHKAGLPKP